MIRALFIGATGMTAQQLTIDVIANNLANSGTTGFKKSRADFQDLIYQDARAAGAISSGDSKYPSGMQVGLGVRPAAVQKVFLQGDMSTTGNTLDLAIEGDGFFQITQTDGTLAYTRGGAFKLDSDGNIVNSDGLPLEPAITIPTDATQVTVGTDGTVSILRQSTTTPTTVGQIELARFVNPGGLMAMGKNLFTETASSGTPTVAVPGTTGIGTIQQGYLEMSNVDIIEEMVGLIIGQRSYEANSKTVSTADSMMNVANGLKN